MRNILLGASAIVFSVVFAGCVNSGPAPQDVKLQNMDGRAVIIKDIYELPLIENKKLKETEIVKIFFPKADNVSMNCSMTLIKIPSGIQAPKYKQTSSQIIYAISGGGKLLIGNNMIVLKKGIMVYVPPNAEMSITNNVNTILELVIVTSPPFETSQMTVLGEKSVKVPIAKDLEDSMNSNEDDKYQTLSKKYKSQRRSQRTLSVEEYRTRMSKTLLPETKEKDPIADLLKDDLEDKNKHKKKNHEDTWSLKIPDNSKVPLKKLEEEQREKLIPKAAQKVEKTSLENVQELTPSEHKVPIYNDKIKSSEIKKDSSDNDQDSLEKLLKEQEKKLVPEKTLKVKKTSLKNVQELTPAENVPTKSDANKKL